MYGDSQEPLARTLQMQASKKASRKQGMPIGGMQNTVQPMASLDAQAEMDSLQAADALPVGGSPLMRFASMQQSQGSQSPVAMMTAQGRSGGQAPTPQCAPGTQCYANQQRSSLATQMGIPEGILPPGAFNVRVSDGPAQPAAAAAPKPPAPQQPAPREGAAQSQASDLMQQGIGMVERANAAAAQMGLGPMSEAANFGAIGRAMVNQAMTAEQQQKQTAMLEAALKEKQENDALARRINAFNLKAASEKTLFGSTQTVDSALKGIGDFAGVKASIRAHQAAQLTQANYGDNPAQPFDFNKVYDLYHSQAIAHDIGHIVTNIGELSDQDYVYREGAAQYLQSQINNRYYGKRPLDPKGNPAGPIYTGKALEVLMHSDLDEALAWHITQDIMKSNPQAREDDARTLAQREAFEIVDKYYQQVNALNMLAPDTQQQSHYGILQSLEDAASAATLADPLGPLPDSMQE